MSSSTSSVEIEPKEDKKVEETDPEYEKSKTNPVEGSTDPKHSKGEKEQDIYSGHQDTKSIPKEKLGNEALVHLQLVSNSRKGSIPQIYQLPITEKFRNDTFARYAVGSAELDPLLMNSERVLMLVGATGTGKTTLINGIANYIYGTKWEDNSRLIVVHKEGQRSQAYGQTKQITTYTFPQQKGSPLPYTLTVIDTPGFGDSDGLEHDRNIVEQIKEFFLLRPPKGIAFLHGIGLVVKASDGRLTPTQLYIFNSILSLFGKDIEENISALITFCDAGKPFVLNALKEATIPYHGNGFKFNNSALFANKGENEDDDDESDDFNSRFFEMGLKSFKRFFKHLKDAEVKSLQQTKEVLEERKQLEILIQGLRQQIDRGIGKITELQQEEKILSQHKAEIEANEKFTYTITVTEQVEKDTKEKVTNCLSCKFTCHLGCVYNKDKKYCRVIQHDHCTVCPGKCHLSSHVNQPFYYEPKQKDEERTDKHLKERYDSASSEVSQSEAMLSRLNAELSRVKEDVMATIRGAHETLQRLEEIALNPDPLSVDDYIKLCVEAEKREARPGWEERIRYFKDILHRNRYISAVRDIPYENLTGTGEDVQHNHIQFTPALHKEPTEERSQSFYKVLTFESPYRLRCKAPDLERPTTAST